MDRIRNAGQLMKASWGTLRRDPTLLGVAVVATAAALVAGAVVFVAGLLVVRLGSGEQTIATWLVAVATGIVATFVAAIGQAAIVVAASRRMEGGDPGVGEAFGPVRRRLWPLLGWSVIATVVTRLLHLLRRRSGPAGRTAASAGDLAWGVVSFLALPVIMFEGAGAVAGLKRSSTLLKTTWGENVSFNLGLGLLGVALTLPVVAALAVAQAAGALPLSLLGLVPLLVYVLLAVGFYSALSAVLKTALYRWAQDQPVAAPFHRGTLDGVVHST